jgi:hypothetical protein
MHIKNWAAFVCRCNCRRRCCCCFGLISYYLTSDARTVTRVEFAGEEIEMKALAIYYLLTPHPFFLPSFLPYFLPSSTV